MVSYPRVPGHELAGVIDAVGPEVPGEFALGTAVLVVPYTNCGECSACRKGRPNACRNNQTLGVQRDGGLAEEIVVPASKLLTSRRLSLREMVLVEPLSVGWHAARRGRAAAGETVVVFGCGMVDWARSLALPRQGRGSSPSMSLKRSSASGARRAQA